eukprot:NODE_14256_length_1119_cov_5.278226.p1 GENE.NODE_14256_length_1119_cov_5.278226~~NODE_14256_length_1119_cov_5.278226.p1  ORF type:complete len:209 (+),score=19.15 NODE_14256_length_1119_cov_5.278226:490-1116(+)
MSIKPKPIVLIALMGFPLVTWRLCVSVPISLLTGLDNRARNFEQMKNLGDFVAGARVPIMLELGITLLWCCSVCYGCGLLSGLVRIVLSSSVASVIFIFFSQGAHITEECQFAADAGSSWAKRQAETSMNYATQSPFWTFVSGATNMQSLHHCLPGVAGCHFIALWPKFDALSQCGLKQCDGPWAFVSSFVSWTRELAAEDACRKPKQ